MFKTRTAVFYYWLEIRARRARIFISDKTRAVGALNSPHAKYLISTGMLSNTLLFLKHVD